jgi:glycosyltransferase involved in cell wall biosynthesis
MYHADIIGGFAGKLSKIKSIIWNIRGAKQAGTIKPKVFLPIISILSYIIPTKIICCGHEAAKYHSRLGYCSQKIVVIPNGYPFNDNLHISEMVKLLQRKKFRQSQNKELTILSVGRFGRLKDHRTLVNAFSLFNKNFDAKLIMIGSGITSENKKLQRYLSEASILSTKVKLIGEVQGLNELNKYYDQADIFCLSSLSEGFPNVLFEAMSRGCKIVSTDVGDVRRVFHEIGHFCETSNPSALANALVKSKEREISNIYEESCIKLLDKYSLSEMVLSYENVYKKAGVSSRKESSL